MADTARESLEEASSPMLSQVQQDEAWTLQEALLIKDRMIQEVEIVVDGKPRPKPKKAESVVLPGGLTVVQDDPVHDVVTGRDVHQVFKFLDLRSEGARWESFVEPRIDPQFKERVEKLYPSKVEILRAAPGENEIRIRLNGVNWENGGEKILAGGGPNHPTREKDTEQRNRERAHPLTITHLPTESVAQLMADLETAPTEEQKAP